MYKRHRNVQRMVQSKDSKLRKGRLRLNVEARKSRETETVQKIMYLTVQVQALKMVHALYMH
jgi:hypothetical protein